MILVEVRNQDENDELKNVIKKTKDAGVCQKNFTMGMRENKGLFFLLLSHLASQMALLGFLFLPPYATFSISRQ